MLIVSWRAANDKGPAIGSMQLPPAGSVRIGRSKEAELCLDHPEVSRFHAVIITSPAGVEVADTGSGNGTRLGSQRLSHSAWLPQVPLLVGPFELWLEGTPDGEAPSQRPPASTSQPSTPSAPVLTGPAYRSNSGKLDARPRYMRGSSSLWDAATHRRDAFAEKIVGILAANNIIAEFDVSNQGIYPPSLTLSTWLPTPHRFDEFTRTHKRSVLTIAVDVKPFLTHKFQHDLKLTKAGKEHTLALLPEKIAFFNESDLERWVRAALDLGPIPPKRRPVWRILLDSCLPWLAWRNRIAKPYRDAWDPRRIITVLAWLLTVPSFFAQDPISLALLALALALFVLLYLTRSKQQLVCMPPSPHGMPRALKRWGGWDVVLPQLGTDFDRVRSRLLQAAVDQRPEHVEIKEETFAYSTPDGIERRQRFVFRHRQCEVHLHVYPFARDVYVGWEAFLNERQWGETDVVSSRRLEGSKIEFKEIRPAAYGPSEFDWIDLRGLAEFVHRRLEQIIVLMLKERAIDMQLDFKINRSGVDQVANVGPAETSSAQNIFGAVNRFLRRA